MSNVSNVALVPQSAPFSPDQIHALNTVVGRSDPLQRSWLAGFLAGVDASRGAMTAPSAAPQSKIPLTILYASESGNSEALAMAARKAGQKRGFDARVHDMADVDLGILAKAKNVIIYAATWGEGDPPQRALEFYDALMGEDAPRLEGVNFAVLGLGDSAYVNFCETARRIDLRLAELGATRSAERIDLDLDYARPASAWTETTLAGLRPVASEPHGTVVHVDFNHQTGTSSVEGSAYTAESPLEAEISALVNLNGTRSSRETWHVELATDAPGFAYQPGDAIGVVPENNPELVVHILESVGIGDDPALAAELTTGSDITTLSRQIVQKYANLTGRSDVAQLADQPDTFQTWAADRQLIDLFAEYGEKLTADDLRGLLRPLPGRLYSVASSPLAHEGEAHLLVGAVRWQAHDRQRGGVASTHLADRRRIGDTLKLYVKPNRHFRLPEDNDRPIIMIGAGTGIAPYRSFVAQRAELGASGRNWLFFGERNYTYDFLYQLEWQEHLAAGTLDRLDVAFSRDQQEKIYVQHRLWERRSELRAWIDDGAHIYVCGDEKGMARDVHATLAGILADGDATATGESELKALSKAGRYQRDVY